MIITRDKISLCVICFYLFAVTFFLDGSIGIRTSRLLVLCIYCMLLLFDDAKFRITRHFVWEVALVVYSLFTSFFAYNLKLARSGTTTLIVNTITLFCIVNLCMKFEKEYIAICTAKTVAISAVFFGTWIYGRFGLLAFSGTRNIQTTELNANIVGQHTAIGAVLAFYIILRKERKRSHRIFYYIIFTLNILYTVLSGSRKSLLYVAVPLLLYYVLISKSNYKRIIRILGSVVIFACLWMTIMIVPALYNTIGYRLDNLLKVLIGTGAGDDSTSFRFLLIEWGIQWFRDRPIWGYGADNFRALVGTHDTWAGPAGTYAHNNFLELLVDFGIIGTIIYYSLYVGILSKLRKILHVRTDYSILFMALFIAMWICELGVVSYYEKFSQTLLAIIWVILCGKKVSA